MEFFISVKLTETMNLTAILCIVLASTLALMCFASTLALTCLYKHYLKNRLFRVGIRSDCAVIVVWKFPGFWHCAAWR